MELKPDKAALLPCPFCGMTPDVNDPNTFQTNQGTKWGFVVCCCNGPEVRTSYKEADFWRDDAIAAWNTRTAVRAEDGMRKAHDPRSGPCPTCGFHIKDRSTSDG